MAMPQSTSARSTSHGAVPSSALATACERYGPNMRLPMNPNELRETTAVFFKRRASAIDVASTSSSVAAPRTTSSSFITGAGLKK